MQVRHAGAAHEKNLPEYSNRAYISNVCKHEIFVNIFIHKILYIIIQMKDRINQSASSELISNLPQRF